MPRTKPPKPTRRPAKLVSHRRNSTSSASSLHLDGDDGYSGVDDVTDAGEDDEAHVLAAEQEHLTKKIRIKVPQKWSISSTRPQPNPRHPEYAHGEEVDDEDEDKTSNDDRGDQADDEDGDDEGGGDDDDDEDDNDSDEDGDESVGDRDDRDINHLDEHDHDNEDSTLEDVNSSWAGIVSEHDEATTAQYKQVRFTGIPDDSDSTISEMSHADMFPDIFVPQTALDPAFLRQIELDDGDSSNSGSYWDYSDSYDIGGTTSLLHQPCESAATASLIISTPVEAASCDPQEPDGYETLALPILPTFAMDSRTFDSYFDFAIADETPTVADGETSEGETTDEEVAPGPILPQFPPAFRFADAAYDSAPRTPTRAPRACALRVQRGRPRVGSFGVDCSAKKVLMVNQKAQKVAVVAQPCSPLAESSFPNDVGHLDAGLFSGRPLSALDYMFYVQNPLRVIYSSDSSILGNENDEGEWNLDDLDFLKSGSDGEPGDALGDEHHPHSPATPAKPTFLMPAENLASETNAASPIDPLLSHFDKRSDKVGAFRLDQTNKQLIHSQKATQDSLDLSSGLYHGTLRGIKKNSMGTVTTAITPARRRKTRNARATGEGIGVDADKASAESIAESPSIHTGYDFDHDDLNIKPFFGEEVDETEPLPNPISTSKKRALGDDEGTISGVFKRLRSSKAATAE